MTQGTNRAFAVLATVVVGAAVVWGFVVVGSPDARRIERMDERRVDDLRAIHHEIQALVHDAEKGVLKRPLPQTLDEVARQARYRKLSLTDPETGLRYEYAVTGETTYELCATFSGPRDADRGVFWNHPAGPHCFRIDVLDPP